MQVQTHRRRAWQPHLAALLVLAGGQALAADDIVVPSNVNFRRLQLLERPANDHQGGLMKVYVLVKGETVNGSLLLTSAQHLQRVTIDNFRQLLLDRIKETGRFDVYNHDSTGVMDKTSIVVEGRIVRATQHIENLVVARKAITRVGLSINITETDSGQVLRAKTFTGHYGDKPGEGAVFVSDTALKDPQVQEALYKDYDRALNDALDDASGYLEAKYRAVGKVTEKAGNVFVMAGGEQHGFNGGDEVVLFRTRFTKQNDERVPGIMTGLARAVCSSVNEQTSTCKIVKMGNQGDVQPGDYAVVANESLKH